MNARAVIRGSSAFRQWNVAPLDLVSLLEILEISADAYWRLSGTVGQLIARLAGPARSLFV